MDLFLKLTGIGIMVFAVLAGFALLAVASRKGK